MTERKPPGVSWESWFEEQIRQAQEITLRVLKVSTRCPSGVVEFRFGRGTGPWHPSGKLVKSLPMGSPSQG